MFGFLKQSVEVTQPQFSGSGFAFTPLQSRMLLLGLALATGMEFYTFDSMNLVLVDIAGTLGVSPDEASWMLTVYSSALFLGVPVSIWAAGHFGYKRFFMATVVLFAVSAIGCSLAPTLGVMLIWRAVQGAAGAGLVVWWRAAIYLLLSKPQRSLSLMRVSTGLYLASAAGLLVSGYVTDHYNWRLIFLPNLVLAAGALWILSRVFPDFPPARSARLQNTDWLGLVLLATWAICLQIILSRGYIDDWFGSSRIRLLACAGFVSFVGFVFWQLHPKNRYALLDIRLLANRHVMASTLIGVCTGMVLSGSLYVLPRFLRHTDSAPHSATQTGQLICVYALAAAIIRPFVPSVISRIGQRKAIAIAMGMLIFSMLLLNRLLTTETPDGYYVLPLLLYAFCLAPLLPAVGSGTVARVEQNQLLDGVSLYMTFRQFGASLGVACLTILIEWRETLHSSRLFEHVRTASVQTQDWLSGMNSYLATRLGQGTVAAHASALRLLDQIGSNQADTLSFADAFLFMALIGLVALCLVPLVAPVAGPSPAKPAINLRPNTGTHPGLAGQSS
ncbi:MAG: DHA2 family efflux MFS transporter permease subunit [Verrucomicrobiota bacterium]